MTGNYTYKTIIKTSKRNRLLFFPVISITTLPVIYGFLAEYNETHPLKSHQSRFTLQKLISIYTNSRVTMIIKIPKENFIAIFKRKLCQGFFCICSHLYAVKQNILNKIFYEFSRVQNHIGQ